MRTFAGVDGGGTRTRTVIIDAEGAELGRGEFDGAVVTAHEPERAAEAVRRAMEQAAEAAGVALPVHVLWAGLAGAGATAPRAAVTRALREFDLAERLIIGTDVEAAFHDAFSEGPGAMLIAGTGSIAWARDAEGHELRVGGWGRLLGDEGSGYRIGLEGLSWLTRAEDGRAPPTEMRETLLTLCGVSSVDDLVAWMEAASKGDVAALAPAVIECAEGGDEGAETIVESAVDALGEHLEAVFGAMGTAERDRSSIEVALWGGLVAPGGPLEARMSERLRAMGLAAAGRQIDPPMGAARLARASVAS